MCGKLAADHSLEEDMKIEIDSIETQIVKLEDDIRNDLAQLPSWVRFLIYWYFRLTDPEERDGLDRLFRGVGAKEV